MTFPSLFKAIATLIPKSSSWTDYFRENDQLNTNTVLQIKRGLNLKRFKMSQDLEKNLFKDLTQLIEQGKQQVATQVNSVHTITYWHVG